MSNVLVFGALLATVLFGGFIGGLFWWVRRPLSSRRQSGEVLPLFGHDRAVVYARAEEDGDEADDGAQLIMARAPGRTAHDGASIRHGVPTDSTLQFLPGRLEIIRGPDLGRDIRFVRTPGREVIDVTFGRDEGPPHRHIQLHDATVSRAHACLRYRDGRWLLSNLSATSPVLHNSVPVDADADLPLAEGDRIEMGAVVFRFHA